MTAEVARNSKLEVQATIDAAKTITAITKANPAVATTSAPHGLANGDVVVLAIEGMTELDGLVARVSNVAASTFEITVDSTNFGTFTTGTAKEILTWHTVSEATQVNFGAGNAEQLEKTRLIDRTKRFEAGLPDQPNVSVNVFSDVTDTAQVAIEAAGLDGTKLGFRYTRKSGKVTLFGGTPSTVGEDNNVGQMVTGSFSVTISSPRSMHYAS